jgi:predicted DNA-binding transcriptional regulator YafY
MGIIIIIIIIIIVLLGFISSKDSKSNTSTNHYKTRSTSSYNQNTSSVKESSQVIKGKIRQAISSNHDIKIEYIKYDGTYSSRRLSDVSFNNEFKLEGYNNDHIKGFCHLRGEERTFRISRITSIKLI